jgi:hypothetical protein
MTRNDGALTPNETRDIINVLFNLECCQNQFFFTPIWHALAFLSVCYVLLSSLKFKTRPFYDFLWNQHKIRLLLKSAKICQLTRGGHLHVFYQLYFELSLSNCTFLYSKATLLYSKITFSIQKSCFTIK